MPKNKISVPIPHDLKPGDVIVDSAGNRKVFCRYFYGEAEGQAFDAVVDGGMRIFRSDGTMWNRPKEPHAVHIIRKASKPVRQPREWMAWGLTRDDGEHVIESGLYKNREDARYWSQGAKVIRVKITEVL